MTTYAEVLARIGARQPAFASHPDVMSWRPPETQWLVRDLLPVGYTVVLGAPKTGKTALILPQARALADAGYKVLYLSWDDPPRRIHQRLKMAAPQEELPNLWFNWHLPTDSVESMALVSEWLVKAQAAGAPFDALFVDTYGAFQGQAKPGRSAFQSDYNVGASFKHLCDRHGISLVATHHTRKGEESEDWLDMANGTGGIAASSDAIWYIRRTRGSREGVLKVVGNDVEERAWPLTLADDMQWIPSETVTVAEAGHRGVPRETLELLAQKSAGLAAIVEELGAPRNTVRRALQDLRTEGLIWTSNDEWHLCREHRDNRPPGPWEIIPAQRAPGNEERSELPLCEVCGRRMVVIEPDQLAHPACQLLDPGPADVTAPSSGPGSTTEAGATVTGQPPPDDSDDDRAAGFAALAASIRRSRMNPVPRVPGANRDKPPWTLIEEWMTGEHAWTRSRLLLDSDTTVVVLDRRGSYPSAMGSVPVGSAILAHTGPLGGLPADRAGLLLIEAVPWHEPDIGHPLGRIGDRPGPWWVTTPHLLLLDRLAAAGRCQEPVILDSWTSRRATSLFTAFSAEVQEQRLSALAAGPEGTERYVEVKRASSIAIRCLWPKGARSPFWRPDWSVSVRAEAAVRHWAQADKAKDHGATLLHLGAVDEVVLIPPAEGEVPTPYVLGDRYGQVSVKEQINYTEWAERADRKR